MAVRLRAAELHHASVRTVPKESMLLLDTSPRLHDFLQSMSQYSQTNDQSKEWYEIF